MMIMLADGSTPKVEELFALSDRFRLLAENATAQNYMLSCEFNQVVAALNGLACSLAYQERRAAFDAYVTQRAEEATREARIADKVSAAIKAGTQ